MSLLFISPDAAMIGLTWVSTYQDLENVNRYRPEMLLRTAPKVKMKIDFTDKEKVRQSPYYLCNQYWEKIDSAIQTANNIFDFSKQLRKIDLTDL